MNAYKTRSPIPHTGHVTQAPHQVIQDFENMAIAMGFRADFEAEPDGILHRVPLEQDERGRFSGWYVLFPGTILAGRFGNWITGESRSWSAKSPARMTAEEVAEFRTRIAESKAAQRDAERAHHDQAARRAVEIWQQATPASGHPYLAVKGDAAHGTRTIIWPHGFFDPETGERDGTPVSALVIPMYDTLGTIWSLAAIAPDGRKDFLFGGRKRGCYFMIGTVVDTLCIVEGFTTGASIFEATGYAVAVAFDCGNLRTVAMELREQYPTIRIIVCVDDDRYTAGNPGRTKAEEAERAIDALLAMPAFQEGGAE